MLFLGSKTLTKTILRVFFRHLFNIFSLLTWSDKNIVDELAPGLGWSPLLFQNKSCLKPQLRFSWAETELLQVILQALVYDPAQPEEEVHV